MNKELPTTMTKDQLRKLTGWLLVIGPLLVNIPYALLIANFEYPDILREPTAYILTKFQAGGTGLVFTWLAFAWVGLPLLLAIITLQKVLNRDDTPYLWVGTFAGVTGAIAQITGLLRWVFVVPMLARLYADPASTPATRDAAAVAFQVIHQYGGVIIGEHIGQIFTIIWMVVVSLAIFRSDLFRPWVAWLGFIAAAIYFLAQSELLGTAIPDFPVVPEAGLIGSLLWLAWMIVVGVFLLRTKRA
jgi:hypothetical protein